MNYTHVHDMGGRLLECSAAQDMGHRWPDGRITPTGLGFCPHHIEDDDPVIVEVPWPHPDALVWRNFDAR